MPFSGKRIRQVRELHGFTQTDLAVRVEVSQAFIGQVERGLKPASSDLVEQISRHTKFPVPFFTEDPPIEFPPETLMFRSHADITHFQETEARRYAEILAEMDLALQKYISPVAVKIPILPHKSPEEAARMTRHALGIPSDEPIANLVRMIENAGVLVLAIPAELPGRNAFSLWMAGKPIIALIKGSTGARLRMDVAHELAHLVMQHSRITRAEEERNAFLYAGALIMPEAAMRREISTPVTLSSIAVLKPRWRVSIQALIRRAKDLDIVTERQYSYLNAQVSMKGWKKKEPGEFPPEKPRLLRQILEDVRGVSVEHFANELKLDPAFVREVMDGYAAKPTVRNGEEVEANKRVTLLKRR